MKLLSPMFILSFLGLFSFLVSCESLQLNPSDSESQEVLRLVNKIRKDGCKCGSQFYEPVGALTYNETLESTALGHSKDMAANNYFGHTNKGGFTAEARLDQNNYPWTSYGENIYQNTDPNHTAADAVQAWIDSPGHCINMMKPHFTEMGVANYEGYWTQLLGSR